MTEKDREREREQYFQRETGNQCGQRRLGRETDVSNTAKLTKDIILMMELFSCHRQKEIENVYKGKRLTVLERERGACNHKGLASACPKHCLTWARCYILFRAVKTKFDKKTFTANFVKIEM